MAYQVSRFVSAVLSFVLFAFLTFAQLPSNQKLSSEGEREFNKELERLKELLSTANDKGAVELQIANTYVAGGQFSEAVRRLREVVQANLGFDPSRDPDFKTCGTLLNFDRSWTRYVARQRPFTIAC